MKKRVLKFGLPKGSLETATLELFRRAGWNIMIHDRSYFPEIDDPEITCNLIRAQEISRYVEKGVLDVGITGKDWISENDSDIHVVAELIYSKVSKRPARWILAVRDESPIRRIEDMEGKKISTELVQFTKRFFSQKGIRVDVEFSWGATEAKVIEGLVDAIVDVTETGATLRANGLRIVAELMSTAPQLIANHRSWKDPWKRKKIQQIEVLLRGALNAYQKVGLKMNVPEKAIERIIPLLPSLRSPTISKLYGEDWYAIEVVVNENMVRELIPQLQEAGAEGFIEYPLNKVI